MPRSTARGDLVPTAILGLIGARGPVSRTEIARSLDVSPATVTQATKLLLARGLVTELDTAPSQGGRPARLLGLTVPPGAEGAPGALGVKVADTHVSIVHADLAGTVLTATEEPFASTAPDALERLARLLEPVVERHRSSLLGIGVGVPGAVDTQASGAVAAPTLGWPEALVGQSLRTALRVPVLVENDVNTLAVAESLYGIGREHSSYVVVTIGRGIGCGIVVDGALYRGANGGAGEIGHIPMATDGPTCGCGNTGCLEAFVGEAGLVRDAREAGVIAQLDGYASLVARAVDGDAGALALFDGAGTLLGRALAGVVHTVDPEAVLLLGEGMDAWPYWRPGFERSFRAHLMPSRRSTPLLTETWADDKWALGAAALVLSSSFDSSGATGEQGRRVRERLGRGGARR